MSDCKYFSLFKRFPVPVFLFALFGFRNLMNMNNMKPNLHPVDKCFIFIQIPLVQTPPTNYWPTVQHLFGVLLLLRCFFRVLSNQAPPINLHWINDCLPTLFRQIWQRNLFPNPYLICSSLHLTMRCYNYQLSHLVLIPV